MTDTPNTTQGKGAVDDRAQECEAIVEFIDTAAVVSLIEAGKVMAGEPSENKSAEAMTGMQVALALSQLARRIQAGQHRRDVA